MASPQPPRPLIVRIRNWVGDVVVGLPALRLLQAQGYALTLVARGKWAPALLAGEGWAVHVQPAALADKVRQLRALRAECRRLDPGFDRRENALLLPVSLSSALEMRLAGLRAVGFAKEGRTPLMARGVPLVQQGHELTRYFALACRFLGVDATPPPAIGLQVLPAKAAEAQALLAARGVTGPYIVICPFAGGRVAIPGKPTKTWPDFARFTALAAAGLGLPVVVYPGPGEHALARELYPAAHLIEGADLGVYAALLQRAALVVANDTGPGHMAAAVGSRVISVLGPTVAERWAPWGPQVRVLQRAPTEPGPWPDADEALALARALLALP
ncbi:MAG: glycosyltransferase family 9 protein [Burkholderiales bacterium]|nr:glycosyltransferase family 9 protein [Burkholderiales bacterium]MDE2276076.1 glycosyltransferase family 9 protein [Burkholderiales bacterium]